MLAVGGLRRICGGLRRICGGLRRICGGLRRICGGRVAQDMWWSHVHFIATSWSNLQDCKISSRAEIPKLDPEISLVVLR